MFGKKINSEKGQRKKTIKSNSFPIRETINVHDKFQFETRFDYSLDIASDDETADFGRRQVYDIEAYFFIPKQMGMNPETYKKSDFYQDIRSLVRFKEPHLSYQKFLGKIKEGRLGPLGELEQIIEKLSQVTGTEEAKHLIHNAVDIIRFFACCFASNFRRKVRRRGRNIREYFDSKNPETLIRLQQMFSDFDPFLQRYFSLLRKLSALKLPVSKYQSEVLNSELLLAEEYCFYRFREGVANAVDTINLVHHEIPLQELSFVKKRLRIWARFIYWFERARNFTSIEEDSTPKQRETFLSRLGSIKKYISRVLYLEVRPNIWFLLRKQSGYLLAAALAAFCYFLVSFAIFSYLRFGDFSSIGSFHNLMSLGGLTAILAFIGAYVLRDGIKEIGKSRFSNGVLGKVPDRVHNISYTDSSGKRIYVGKMSESVKFVRDLANVPQEIRQIRNTGELWNEEGQFNVLCYQKTIELEGTAIAKFKPFFTTVKEITRISIRRFLTKLDDPIQIYLGLLRKGAVEQLGMPKVYYVGVALKFATREKQGQSGFNYQVLVLDKNGLLRIDEIANSVRTRS